MYGGLHQKLYLIFCSCVQYILASVPKMQAIYFSETLSVISGFRRDVDEFCAILGYGASSV